MGGSQLLPALESGTVDAALLSPPMLYFARKKGFRELLDVGSRVRMPLGGLTVLVSTLRNRPDELKRVIRSLQAAKQDILRSREKSVALTDSFLKLDRHVAEDRYSVYRKTVSGNGVPTHDGIDQIINSLQAAGQFTDRKVTFEEVADDSFAKEVDTEGLVIIRYHFCADPHLDGIDLRIVAVVDRAVSTNPELSAIHEIDKAWDQWLGSYLANHRCG